MTGELKNRSENKYDVLDNMSDEERRRFEEYKRLEEERIDHIVNYELVIQAAEREGYEFGRLIQREINKAVGFEIGKEKANIQITKNLISMGMDDDFIMKVTENTANYIAKLRFEVEKD
jgi:hypothetical protein